MSDLKDKNKYPVVFYFGDDTAIAHPVSPLTASVGREPLAALSWV